MLSEEEMRMIHKKTGATKQQILECERYRIRHPYDHLQPGDRGFDRVWGRKRKEEEKLKRRRRDDELEVLEKEEFDKRKKGMDKVHKRFTVLSTDR